MKRLSIRDAADILAVSPTTIRRLIKSGLFRTIRNGNGKSRIYLFKDEILAYSAKGEPGIKEFRRSCLY